MQDPKNTNNKRIKLLTAGLVLIAGLCLIFLFYYISTEKNAAQEIQTVQKDYVRKPEPTVTPQTPSPSPAPTPTPSLEPQPEDILAEFQVPELEIEFTALQEEVNSDIYAWILIPDTPINYPVLQHPDDNIFYLTHNLDGSSGYPGCIYTENYNSKEWDDVNTILYGHNMKNGSMFAGLHSFEDEDFFEEHPYVYLYTPDAIRVYHVFAAYEFSDLHLMVACDWNDPEDVSQFFSEMTDYPGHFDETVELNSDDNYLTLSTCISGKSNNRFLVHAILAAEVSL